MKRGPATCSRWGPDLARAGGDRGPAHRHTGARLPAADALLAGDAVRRDYHLGQIVGRFRRELARRIQAADPGILDWLQQEHCLDRSSAQNAIRYVREQMEVLGTISSDRTVIAELFTDPLGDLRLVIHSCLGARVNSPWALALAGAFGEALGSPPEVMVSDDGILFRFLEADREPPLELIREMGPAEARERLLSELPNSALFGAQFRMNAGRALLLPAAKGGQKRTPSGCNGCEPRICWPRRRALTTFRSWPRPTAIACATSSTWRTWRNC